MTIRSPARAAAGAEIRANAAELSPIKRRLWLSLEGNHLQRWLPAEHAAAAVGMREPPLFGDHIDDRRSGRAALDPAGLVVEPLERGEPVVLAELRLLHGGLHDGDRLVIDLQRHREGMPVFSPMGAREAARDA